MTFVPLERFEQCSCDLSLPPLRMFPSDKGVAKFVRSTTLSARPCAGRGNPARRSAGGDKCASNRASYIMCLIPALSYAIVGIAWRRNIGEFPAFLRVFINKNVRISPPHAPACFGADLDIVNSRSRVFRPQIFVTDARRLLECTATSHSKRKLKEDSYMGSAVLGDAIGAIRDWSAKREENMSGASDKGAFGSLVFDDAQQQKRLPKNVYDALRRTVSKGEALDPSIADAVAGALKDWASESGATHYTHWFQPLTGITAEKHDSFLAPGHRRQGGLRVLGQGARERRARCLELPVRRHAIDLRSARLHRMGSDQPAVAAQERRRDDPRHSDRLRQLDR